MVSYREVLSLLPGRAWCLFNFSNCQTQAEGWKIAYLWCQAAGLMREPPKGRMMGSGAEHLWGKPI